MGVADWLVRDDHLSAAGPTPRLRAIALGESGLFLIVNGRRFAYYVTRENDALTPKAS